MAVGTNLQAILTRMALEIREKHAVVQGIPLVQGSDKYFWFGRPQLVLFLIHFALFQVYDSFLINKNLHQTFLIYGANVEEISEGSKLSAAFV